VQLYVLGIHFTKKEVQALAKVEDLMQLIEWGVK
jgi:hypothetical protein